MNDLSTDTNHQLVLPFSTTNHKSVQSIFDSIRSFEDLKREFLLGEGLSPNTYRNYLQAMKRFYEFTNGLHLFRRTYATCLYRAGMGIKAIQAKTRHASIGTLVKHYIYEVEDASPYLKKLI